jgi:uncharacterized membrane protein YphA (DoxX/SURF4 family)
MEAAMIVMRYVMGVIFVVIALLKFIDWRGFVHAYRKYDMLASRSTVYAYAYPVIELLLGVGFLVGWQVRIVALVTLVLMVESAVSVLRALFSKKKIDQCGCLGTVVKLPLTKFTLGEDVVMGLMALVLLVFS